MDPHRGPAPGTAARPRGGRHGFRALGIIGGAKGSPRAVAASARGPSLAGVTFGRLGRGNLGRRRAWSEVG